MLRLPPIVTRTYTLFPYTTLFRSVSIVAALELGRRRKETTTPVRAQIVTSRDAYTCLLSTYADLNHEEFWVLLLNTANRVIGKLLISKGGREIGRAHV